MIDIIYKIILFTNIIYKYYLQNCKAITFEKIENHTKYKKHNAPGVRAKGKLYRLKNLHRTKNTYFSRISFSLYHS